MALINPHPALKVAAPESPMIDGWMGDDWFHYGAFRQLNLDYFTEQTSARGRGAQIPREGYDDYTNFLAHGSAGDLRPLRRTRAASVLAQGGRTPRLRRLLARPGPRQNHGASFRSRSPSCGCRASGTRKTCGEPSIAMKPSSPKTPTTTRTFSSWDPGATARSTTSAFRSDRCSGMATPRLQFRRDVLLPFFNQYLLDNAPKADTPPVLIYNTGENHWDRFKSWPLSCDSGCPDKSQPLYLTANRELSFEAPQRIVAKVRRVRLRSFEARALSSASRLLRRR